MSIEELIHLVEGSNTYVTAYLIAIPLLSYLASLIYKPHPSNNVLDYFFTILIYLIAIPGMFAFCLVSYSLLFIHANMLKVDFVIYFLPLISMGVTFYLISRATDFVRLPGFKKLSGLMLLLLMVMTILFFLYRLRVYAVFFGSFTNLLFLGIGAFILMRFALGRIKAR